MGKIDVGGAGVPPGIREIRRHRNWAIPSIVIKASHRSGCTHGNERNQLPNRLLSKTAQFPW
jgi:hypothetical protein